MLSARHLMRGALLAASASLAILTIAPASSEAFEPHLAPVAQMSRAPSIEASDGRLDSAAAPKRLARIEELDRPSASPARVRSATRSSGAASSSNASRAGADAGSGTTLQSLLAEQIRQHPILRGTTISYGDAQGYQAISYYRSGRIVVSRSHTASLSRIVAHEVWHVIDWRDNGRIDWGENVPPR